MSTLDKILKDTKEDILVSYMPKEKINKKIKQLENERFKYMKKRLDSLYDNYTNDFMINVINIKLDVLYEIMKGE